MNTFYCSYNKFRQIKAIYLKTLANYHILCLEDTKLANFYISYMENGNLL